MSSGGGTLDVGSNNFTAGAEVNIVPWITRICVLHLRAPTFPLPPRPLASHSTPDKKQGGSASPSLFISRLPASQSLPCNPSLTVCLWLCVWLSVAHSNSGYVTQKTMQKAYFILCLQGSLYVFFYYYYFLLSLSQAAHSVVHSSTSSQSSQPKCTDPGKPPASHLSSKIISFCTQQCLRLSLCPSQTEGNLKSLWLFESMTQIAHAGNIKISQQIQVCLTWPWMRMGINVCVCVFVCADMYLFVHDT